MVNVIAQSHSMDEKAALAVSKALRSTAGIPANEKGMTGPYPLNLKQEALISASLAEIACERT